RSFISGSRLWPPASTLASACSASRPTASPTERTAAYLNDAGIMRSSPGAPCKIAGRGATVSGDATAACFTGQESPRLERFTGHETTNPLHLPCRAAADSARRRRWSPGGQPWRRRPAGELSEPGLRRRRADCLALALAAGDVIPCDRSHSAPSVARRGLRRLRTIANRGVSPRWLHARGQRAARGVLRTPDV